MEIIIGVTEKVAALRTPSTIVCGNSDYQITFTFDSEWNDYTAKTAEFKYWRNGERLKKEVVFEGSIVNVPILREIDEVEVGVYAGNLRTTTPARIPCARCITDGDAVHDPPEPDIYNQLMEYLAGLQGGGAPAGITVPQLYGAAADAAGATTIIEEGMA